MLEIVEEEGEVPRPNNLTVYIRVLSQRVEIGLGQVCLWLWFSSYLLVGGNRDGVLTFGLGLVFRLLLL